MPVSIHTDDNRSPRSELLSPTSSSSRFSYSQPQSNSQSQSPPPPTGDRDRERRHRSNHHHRKGHHNGSARPHTAEANGHASSSNDNQNNQNNKSSSKAWWRSREQALSQTSYTKQDLVRMIISAERETSKLHNTLTNTLTLLDTESHKCATLERDTLNTFTHLTNLRETAESLAERTAQDLRVAQFELEHKMRDVERLQRELDLEKGAREEAEKEVGKAKDTAWQLRRERIMDRAKEEGRREGFEKGFMKAQAENALRMQMRAEAEAEAEAAAAAIANAQPSAAGDAVAEPSSATGSRSRSGTASASASGSRRRGRSSNASATAAPTMDPPPAQMDPEPEEEEEEQDNGGGGGGETPYQELNSIPIITPPRDTHTLPNGQTVPMKTGYSPVRRPVAHRHHNVVPQREPTPAPSVDHYPVSIPPQSVIEQTPGVGQPEQWITGAEHSALHGPTPPNPAPLTINANTSNDGHTAAAGPSSAGTSGVSPTSPETKKSRFRVRRPSLKQTAASWYRSFSFRKKPKQKVLIDPAGADDAPAGNASVLVTPTDEAGPSPTSGHGHYERVAPAIQQQISSGPLPNVVNLRPPSQRHSRAVSASGASLASGVRSRDYAYPPPPRSHTSQGRHKPRASSIDSSASTHISTSQFDLLNAPGGSTSGYSRGGQANTSVGSLNSLGGGGGRPPSVSGKSARSQAGGISKKLSVIRENPMSRDTTPIRANFNGVAGPTSGSIGGHESPLPLPVRPFASIEGDRRSTRSGRSTSSRMFAVNPDPESPDWQAGINSVPGPSNAVGPGISRPGSTISQRQRQEQQPRPQEQHAFPRQPPVDSTLLRPASALSGGSGGASGSVAGGVVLPTVAPLRTKKSGLSNGSGASGPSGSGGAIDTPTPMPKGDKGKGRERVYPPGMIIGEATSGSGNDTSPGIGIAVQTPSDRARNPSQQGPVNQEVDFLSPRPSSFRSLPPSRQGGGTSIATSTTKVQEDIHHPQQSYPPRSISPIPRSTPKIFLAQGLPSTESVLPFEEASKPKVTVIKHYDGVGAFGGAFGGGGGAGSVAGSETGHQNYNNAGMTPGPALFHPLPSRAAAALPQQQQHLGVGNGQGMYLQLERAGSTSSLRSQGSYGKFDSSKYVDPAFWGAPAPVQVQMQMGHEGGYGRPRSRQSMESKRISYADP